MSSNEYYNTIQQYCQVAQVDAQPDTILVFSSSNFEPKSQAYKIKVIKMSYPYPWHPHSESINSTVPKATTSQFVIQAQKGMGTVL